MALPYSSAIEAMRADAAWIGMCGRRAIERGREVGGDALQRLRLGAWLPWRRHLSRRDLLEDLFPELGIAARFAKIRAG